MANDLASTLTTKGIARKSVVLVLLANSDEHLMPADIKTMAAKHGYQKIKKWNVSSLLSDLGGAVARYEDGWAITDHGRRILSDLGLSDESPITSPQIKLRQILSKISEEQTKAFVDEAVRALEFGLLRSAIVLSWVGAIGILHKKILENHLSDFNHEYLKRFPKAKAIKKLEDLEIIKEFEFLQISRAIGVFGKNVKDELEICLKLRNGCGHPNNLKVGEHRVASHIETLILNVYEPHSS